MISEPDYGAIRRAEKMTAGITKDGRVYEPVIHNKGKNACGRVAWYQAMGTIKTLALIRCSDVLLPDLTHPKAGEVVRCGACGADLLPSDTMRQYDHNKKDGARSY